MKRTRRKGLLALGLNLAVSLALLGAIIVSMRAAEASHNGYTVSVAGAGTNTLTIAVSGQKPGPGQEISHVEFSICGGVQGTATATGNQGPKTVGPAGAGSSHQYKVDNLSDADLPLTITVTFSSPVNGLSGVFLKTGGGPDAGFNAGDLHLDTSCTPPTATPTPTGTPVLDGILRIFKTVINDDNGTATAGDFTIVVYDQAGNEVFRGAFTEDSVDPLSGEIEIDLPPGTYRVVEEPAPGYELAWFDCLRGRKEQPLPSLDEIIIDPDYTTTCDLFNEDLGGQQPTPTPTPSPTNTPTPTPTGTPPPNTPTPTPTSTATPTPTPQSQVAGIQGPPPGDPGLVSEVAGIAGGPGTLPTTGDPARYPWALLAAFGASLVSLGVLARRYLLAA